MTSEAVKSADRALRIIELLGDGDEDGLSFSEVSARLSLPKSSTYTLLATMVSRSFLSYEKASKRYRLGLRVWEAGQSYERGHDLERIARPYLEACRDVLDETIQLAVLDGIDNVYIGKVESKNQRLILKSRVGSRLPAYSTGLGKALLAALPDEEVARRLRLTTMVPFTSNTITDVPTLLAALVTVRRNGYAVDDNECVAGVVCVAVPIPDASGVVAAMSVPAPEVRVTKQLRALMIVVLREHAYKLSVELGFKGPVLCNPANSRKGGTGRQGTSRF